MSNGPWLDVDEGAARARVGRKIIYRAVAAGRLRAAHVDGRRKLIFHVDWIDAWLMQSAPAIVDVVPRSQGAA